MNITDHNALVSVTSAQREALLAAAAGEALGLHARLQLQALYDRCVQSVVIRHVAYRSIDLLQPALMAGHHSPA